MRRLLLAVLLLTGLFPLSAAARTLLVVGDSLSAAYGMEMQSGWVALLGKRLKQEFAVYTDSHVAFGPAAKLPLEAGGKAGAAATAQA